MKTAAVLLIGLVLLPATSHGQPAVVHPDDSQALASRWAWAVESARGVGQGYWIGYGIDKLMPIHSFFGAFGSRRDAHRVSIYALLGEPEKAQGMPESLRGQFWSSGQSIFRTADDPPDGELQLKELGILFYFEDGADAPSAVRVSNLALTVDLKGRPIYWLGKADQQHSVALLSGIWEAPHTDEAGEELLLAIGIHDVDPDVLNILSKVLLGNYSADLRETAAFWVGRQDTRAAFDLLRRIIEWDASLDVREKAVFSIGQMTLVEAEELLIDLARSGKNEEVQKSAIFWLGQKASRKVEQVLESIVYEDADAEVQEHAVFALSQQPPDVAIPKLIEIATGHPHVEVRKKAIFWLGDSGDPRAVETLVSLIQ